MHLPDRVKDIRRRYVARFPVPQGSPGDAFEESARQWSIRFAEQVAFEVGPMWGMKRADPGRPISKDTIALSQDGRLLIWDLLTGTGTGSPRLVDDPESEDVTGQTFVSVAPADHLGAGAPAPSPRPADVGGDAVSTALARIEARLTTIADRLDAIEQGFNAKDATLSAIIVAQEAARGMLDALMPQVARIEARPEPVAYVGAIGVRLRLTPEYPRAQQ